MRLSTKRSLLLVLAALLVPIAVLGCDPKHRKSRHPRGYDTMSSDAGTTQPLAPTGTATGTTTAPAPSYTAQPGDVQL